MSGHPSPLMIDSPKGTRQATEQELAEWKHDDPKAHKKWAVHNRIVYAKALLKSGESHGDAWKAAFTKYPDDEENERKKFKFVLKKKFVE